LAIELQHISKKYPILSVFYRYQKRFKYHILAHIFFHQTPGLEVRIPSGFHQPGRMSTETPFSPRSIRKWNKLPSAATIASSVGEFRDTLGNLPPAQFLTV
jgi:hypothetical protein